jgi:hypothetical protein
MTTMNSIGQWFIHLLGEIKNLPMTRPFELWAQLFKSGSQIEFAHQERLWLLLAVIPLVIAATKSRRYLAHPRIDLHKNLGTLSPLRHIMSLLLAVSLSASVIGFAMPSVPVVKSAMVAISRAILVMVDVSGSMYSDHLDTDDTKGFAALLSMLNLTVPGYQVGTAPKKAEAAFVGIKVLIDSRTKDRIGLQMFDSRVYPGYPLTFDHDRIVEKLPLVVINKAGGGTNFDGPSATSTDVGAIQGGINTLISAPEKTRVLIMVTDGEDNINAQRFKDLEQEIEDNHLRMYVIGVGPAWKTGTPDLKKFVEAVGGVVIPATNSDELIAGMKRIDQLEPSKIELQSIDTREDVGHIFLIVGSGFLLMFFALFFLVRDPNA